MKPPRVKLAVSDLDREDLLRLVESECRDFAAIPKEEQWVMALYAIGQEPEAIARLTSRGKAVVEKTVERYAPCLTRIPDSIRLWMSVRILLSAIPRLVSRVSDSDVKGGQAASLLGQIVFLAPKLMNLGDQFVEYENRMKDMMDIDGLRAQLGEGKP